MAGYPVFNIAGTAVASLTLNTVAWPTHAANNIGILIIQTDAEASSLVTAAGFTQVAGSPVTTGTAAATNAVALQVFWKRATSSAEASVTLADAGDHTYARILAFTNVITSGNPWNAVAFGVIATAATTASIGTVTTTTADCLVVDVLVGSVDTTTAQASTWTNAALTSLAEIADTASSIGGGGSIVANAGKLHNKGSAGTTTVTLASASKGAWMKMALAPIEPAGSVAMAAGLPVLGATGTNRLNIAATGSAAAPKPVVGSTGTVASTAAPVTGTGTAAVATPTLAGAGKTGPIGIGAVATPKPSLAAAGSQTDKATGSVAAGKPVLAVTGKSGPKGTGTVAARTPALASTGAQTDKATGAVVAPKPVITASGATGAPGVSGSGTAAARTPSIAATAAQESKASGTVAAGKPVLAASGALAYTASGSVAVPRPVLSGVGAIPVLGVGSVAAGRPALAGAGFIPVLGTGTVAIATPQVGAEGTSTSPATASGGGGVLVIGQRGRKPPEAILAPSRATPQPAPKPINPVQWLKDHPVPAFEPPVPWSIEKDEDEERQEITGVGGVAVLAPRLLTPRATVTWRAGGRATINCPATVGAGFVVEPLLRLADDDAEVLALLLTSYARLYR